MDAAGGDDQIRVVRDTIRKRNGASIWILFVLAHVRKSLCSCPSVKENGGKAEEAFSSLNIRY
jgi:hypothetical protein